MNRIFTIIFIVTLWQLWFNFFGNQNTFLPPPIDVSSAFYDGIKNGEILEHVLNSVIRVGFGFSLATLFGVFFGLILSLNRKLEFIFKPIIDLLHPIPPIAWIPIAILLFGLGNNSAYFIVFLGGFFPIFTNTYFGANSIPNIYKNIAKTYEFSNFKYIKKVLFGYTLPYIFTGLKIGMGMSWMSVIAAELIGSQNGLGYFIQTNRLMLRTDNVILGMILIGIIGMILVKIISYFEIKLMPWRENI